MVVTGTYPYLIALSMLTAAVLKVIPNIRFEPARSGGPDSKRIADIVQPTFQFRPAN